MTLVALPGVANARPSPTQVTQLVAAASHQLEIVSEQVNQARVDLAAQQAAADRSHQAADEAEARLDDMRGRIRQIARTAYTTGDVSRLDVLLTSDSPGQLVARMGTLDAIAGRQTAVLHQTAEQARTADQARAQADRAATEAKKTLDTITAKQAELQSQIAGYQQEYAQLTADQQQAVNQQVGGRAVQAAPAAPAALAAPVGASSHAAQVAVQTALAQVGKPYVWGASGPNAFDCSGLMMYSYAAAGVALPHSSSSQSTMGTPVPRNQLQPGDLVFFYSPVSHVGMYIGNGQMVHASTSGTPVQVVDLASMPDYNSARRIG